MSGLPSPHPLHRLEAEQGLLGALIFDNETLNRITPRLRAEHFYDPVHGRIYGAIKQIVAQGKVADAITLKALFATDAGIAEIGGVTYLMRLMEAAAPLSAQVQSYADLVCDLAHRRSIVGIAEEIAVAAQDDGSDADALDLVAHAERRLAEIADDCAPFGLWRPLGEIMERGIAAAEAGEAIGIPTGLDALDAVTGGLTPGSLWVIAGAPSMGKSLVGQAIALNVARAGHGVGYVHLEMGEMNSGLRAATALAHDPKNSSPHLTDTNPTYLGARRQKLSQWGWGQLRRVAAEARGLPMRIDARPHQTLTQIESGAKRLQRLMERAGTPLKALFIDHEGLIAAEKERRAKWEEVSDRIVRLQGLAKKLNVALVVLVQINREGASRDGSQRPHMGHLANSADIERCADVICLLYREAYFAQRAPTVGLTDEEYHRICDQRESQKLEIIVDKSRDGERKTINALLDVRTGYLAEGMQ